MKIKGNLPLLILQILADKPSHGYHIAQQIKHRSQEVLAFKEGTLYPTLHSMEQQGLLESFVEKEQGRTRRYYQLTLKGYEHLKLERQAWELYVKAISQVLGETS